MDPGLTESIVDALEWLARLGWSLAHDLDIVPDSLASERYDYREVILPVRLRNALDRLNPGLPASAIHDAFRKLTCPRTRERGVPPSRHHSRRA